MVIERIYNGVVLNLKLESPITSKTRVWSVKFRNGTAVYETPSWKFMNMHVGKKVFFSGRFENNIFVIENTYSKEEMNALELNAFLERKVN